MYKGFITLKTNEKVSVWFEDPIEELRPENKFLAFWKDAGRERQIIVNVEQIAYIEFYKLGNE